jgi:YD repeat-containing protein
LSGSVCNSGYDGNGNLTAKTDARGVVTSYAYDSLNRLYSKTYTNAPAGTMASCYQYDTASNGIGLLGASWTQAGGCSSSPTSYQSLRKYGAYDPMGRPLTEQQCVEGYCTSTSMPTNPPKNCAALTSATGLQYCYDLAGDLLAYSNGLTTQTAGQYPQQALLFAQAFDSVGRLNSVSSSWSDSTHPQSLFSTPVYTPFNALSSWLMGTQLTTSRYYDKNLRVTGQSSAQ